MQGLKNFVSWCGTNDIMLGMATIVGIFSFALSIIVSFRTAKISKILKYNNLADEFNKERAALWRTAKGHSESIVKDGTKNDVTRNTILVFVTTCHNKYKPLMSIRIRFSIWMLRRILKKENQKINYRKVVNYLADLTAWLAIKEEKKNG